MKGATPNSAESLSVVAVPVRDAVVCSKEVVALAGAVGLVESQPVEQWFALQ